MEQHSIEWYRARLGKITGSMVHTLMGTPKKKGEEFTETAKGYLYQLAAERSINEVYLTAKFEDWLRRTNVETSAMRYGTENEASARDSYAIGLPDGQEVKECGFNTHPTLANYGDSPDGLIYEGETVVGTLEIKCPNPATWMKYYDLFHKGMSLKDIEEKYYWQVQSHMMCSDTKWCDFVYFDKMLQGGIQVVRIEACKEDMDKMAERIKQADEFIKKLVQ